MFNLSYFTRSNKKQALNLQIRSLITKEDEDGFMLVDYDHADSSNATKESYAMNYARVKSVVSDFVVRNPRVYNDMNLEISHSTKLSEAGLQIIAHEVFKDVMQGAVLTDNNKEWLEESRAFVDALPELRIDTPKAPSSLLYLSSFAYVSFLLNFSPLAKFWNMLQH